MQETQVRSLGGENSLEEEMATHSSSLAWEIPQTEEPGRLQSIGSQTVRHNWATEHIYTHLSPFSSPDCDRRVDSPYLSARGSRPSGRTSGWGRSHEEVRDVASWVVPHAERPQFHGPLLKRTRCQHTSLKEILWMKAQHEGALTPACIVQKNPQVPQTFWKVACHPVNNSKGKRRSIHQQKTRCDSLVPTLQGPWDPYCIILSKLLNAYLSMHLHYTFNVNPGSNVPSCAHQHYIVLFH